MATPAAPSVGPNIGISRMLGTNGLQQAVDSLATQVTKLTQGVGNLAMGFRGVANLGRGNNNNNGIWNAFANRANYGANGGGGRFTVGTLRGGAANGGGGNFGNLMGMSRMSASVGAVAGIASALTSYANKNMASNFQLDYFGTSAAIAGGFQGGNYQAANQLARNLAFSNNYVGLNAADVTRAGYINQYTFGAAQFNGAANPAFVSGMRQANAFAYASPTLGATGAATAAQQTYSARAAYVAPTLGLANPYLPGGVKNSMQNIAQSIYQRTFGSQQITNRQINAALSQGGSLDVNLQYFGAQLGWNQNTIQEYRNILQGQVAAQNKGMSETKYYQLLGQASGGNRSAINQLAKTTGMGTSMFENQRNLNATRLTRQNEILDSLAPAFDSATQSVNKFSQALTAFLQATGLDKAIGAGAGTLAPISNALSGLSGGFGAGMGILGAARMFGGGGGILGRLGGNVGSSGARAAASSGGSFLGSISSVLGMVGIGGALMSARDRINAKPNKHGVSINDETAMYKQYMLSHPNATGADIVRMSKLWESGRTTNTDGRPGGSLLASTSNSGSPVSNGQTSIGVSAGEIIQFAETQLNVPYVYGGESPGKGMDCSGLTQWAYGKAGIKIPRIASDQQKTGKAVPVNKTQPGDLLFVGNPAHHVVMSIGGGKIIEAPHTGSVVRIRKLNPSEFTSATRIVGTVGSADTLGSGSGTSQNTLNNLQNLVGGDIGNLSGTSEAQAIASALAGSVASMPLVASSLSAASTSSAGSPIGSDPKGTGKNDKASLQAYAKQLLAKYGWASQWASFNALEMSEAGWDVHATNSSSGAYGLAQALPANKYSSAGSDWKTSGDTQLRWMMDYIKSRYGSPDNAWSFHQRNNWYAAGAWNIDKDQAATVHKGEMIIPAQQAETIRQTLINNTFNPNLQRATGVNSSRGAISFGDIHVTLPNTYTGSAQDARDLGKTIVDAIDEQLRIKNLQIGQ